MKKRAKFNLSNFHNCTFKMGVLYPTSLMEVLPGDTVQLNSSVFMRLAPMVAPVMHPVHMFMHHFFVPTRVVANWMSTRLPSPFTSNFQGSFDFESFITGGKDGQDTQTVPQCRISYSQNSPSLLADAFGIPIQELTDGKSFSVNAFPILAYYLIWNEYYRDQDLQSEYYPVIKNKFWAVSRIVKSSINNLGYFPLLQPCWSKDYFTTARPWPQKGPQVTIPVSLSAGGQPLITADTVTTLSGGSVGFSPAAGNTATDNQITKLRFDGNGVSWSEYNSSAQETVNHFNTNVLFTNPTANSQTTINFNGSSSSTLGALSVDDVRQAFALQRFEEHRALFGDRYEDYLRYLGVRPQDSRLQMPEYLGGFTSPVQFSEVIQTGGESGGIGDLYGHGIAAARGRRVRRFIPEHGYIMSLLCVRPIPVYAQGIERLWNKTTKEDFWQKELEHVGQQEVLNKEVFADGTEPDSNTFGFQNRYDEYRRGVNVITGEFRKNQDFWTMARIFENRPALNADFVECNPTDRIFQVGSQNSDQCYCMVKNNIIARRLISKNGNPI